MVLKSRSRSRSPRRLRYEDVVKSRKRSRWEDDDDDDDNKRDDNEDQSGRKDARKRDEKKEGGRSKRRDRERDRNRDRDRDRNRDRDRERDRESRSSRKDDDDDDDDGGSGGERSSRRRRSSSNESYRRNQEQREEDHRIRSEALKEQEKERERRDRDRERNRDRRRGGGDNKDKNNKDRDNGAGHSKRRHNHQSRRKSRSRSRSPKADVEGQEASPARKEKATLERTHHLVAETNTVNGTVLKHVEPVDARLPPVRDRWKLYAFKGKEHLEDIPLGTRSCWLLGRDRSVADIPTDHPSCSGQHAALQFRFVTSVDEFGEKKGAVKPYIMDLNSVNGTFVNKVRIPSERYYELRSKDLVMFGLSTREYVLMLEK